ncbi:putative tail completion protein [Xanthomonas phage XAJ2]|uniref:Putative tail completion protein n=1 Tax=Xanthomonas phage XAJ2 TaxID=1775249 RepID=A0A1I9L2E8_9CAUD|nr:putative tail completion protein [Xanthomonas phage XAJ2]
MGDLLTLAAKIARLRKGIPQEVSKHAADVTLTMVGYLAFNTPVDTSKALSSWVVTFGKEAEGLPSAHYVGKYGSTYQQSAAETLQVAKRVLKDKKPGDPIYITNNQPYIVKLNDGTHSAQPGGFREGALLLGKKQLGKINFRKYYNG